ncbi:MAG: type II secretion system F family protein [Planctomycetes bacterium]|nr:type II secretion system F family protein [Planctomycetota bacterium]MCC7399327.1 type II secretion system F family protein [Planctomycetota bacterium]
MQFEATILEPDGATVRTRLEAQDEQALHDELGREGRLLVRVRALEDKAHRRPKTIKLHPRRLLLLTQALHEALDAGVPLLGTFKAIADQEEDAGVSAMLDDLGDRVAAGQPLSDALERHPAAFPSIYCSLVRAGEQSGSLPQVLQSVAGFLEWKMEIAGTVKQAMIYPAVIAAAGYGMVMFMMSFVIPRLGAVISKIGSELPAASRILIDASAFVAGNVVAILLGTVGALVATVLLLRTRAVSGAVLSLMGSLPVMRNVLGTLALAQFSRTFAVLLNSGLTMTSALELGGAAVALPRVRDGLEGARERILGGARLGEALEAEAVLPPVALSMVKVGEEAGRLPITFERLGRLYDREVKDAVKKALGLLEPIVTVLLGLIVGGVAVLVVTTIYSAMKGIGK